VVPETATEGSDGSGGKRSPQAAERESSRIGMRDPCNGNHARSRSPVPELSSDIIAERRDVLAQGIQFADLARKICESATDAIDVDSVVFRIDSRKCFVGYHPEIHRRTENALRCPIHPTATSRGLSRPKPVIDRSKQAGIDTEFV
jgi:hypothetical protein